jgi:hypothetical protein
MRAVSSRRLIRSEGETGAAGSAGHGERAKDILGKTEHDNRAAGFAGSDQRYLGRLIYSQGP